MDKAKYRIGRVKIEGFRGFTDPQTIELEEKNIFIFGPNGCGKSSIIEAIRWCLFGSPAGKEIEVRNTFYSTGECRVSLLLSGANETLEVSRELRPGAVRSRQTIHDASGKVVLEREVLPRLARIGHQEGTQVIFAAQQAAGRQSQVDISDFTKVLCFYLRLESVPELIDRLEDLIEERSEEAKEMAGQIEDKEVEYRDTLREVETKFGELMGNPPWGDNFAPVGRETSSKIDSLIVEQARFYNKEIPTSSDSEKLTYVRRWIDEGTSEKENELRERLGVLEDKIGKVEIDLSNIERNEAELNHTVTLLNSAQNALSELESQAKTEDLKKQLTTLERKKTERAVRYDIAKRSRNLCENYDVRKCPICKADVEKERLLTAISECIRDNQESGQIADCIEEIQAHMKRINDTEGQINELKIEYNSLRNSIQESKVNLSGVLEFDTSGLCAKEIAGKIDDIRIDIENIRRQIECADEEKQRKIGIVKDLEEELRYHEYRDCIEQLKSRLGPGMNDVREILEEHRELLDAVSEVKGLIETAFNKALDRAIPTLNDELTEVYHRLTQQASYDQVKVVRMKEQAKRLELRVASSRLKEQSFPINVLNGQAAKAIQLVPYFVFSRFKLEVMELDLLLIDDPSESFDTSHVESLIKELSEASEHAQLVVATHEGEKFEHSLARCFDTELFKIVMVADFDPIKGPKIENR